MDRLTIIKVGGKVVEEPESLNALLDQFRKISGNKLLVHGGGRTATEIAKRLGIETKMVDGRRITDADMLEVVTMVYGGLVNKKIVAGLQARDMNAVGLTGADLGLIKAHKRPVQDVDYGFVGDVDDVNARELRMLIEENVIPVVAPLTHDARGQLLNTNADTIASELAIELSNYFKVYLFYCFEKRGVLTDPNDESSVIYDLDYKLFDQYKTEGVISEGMIPKLDNGFRAKAKGVQEILITNPENIATGRGTRLT
ncbi:N-acetylglutamate kinase [Draconibacterium orientale]|jgi:acetylglutamate kinase|uniref:Acetylglutamate kinase n=1 Tax=Draconibacterium orientale TaxID=1168034 RepID=X5DZT1_9BACT|nr:acetylglutamate kinase [Draconibacterium orientale]AHW60755.1 acetylglutamate kinase [Draconibacterium orientale]SES71291.1 N-acetylglutamate kinase [Draconibacterium orientale]